MAIWQIDTEKQHFAPEGGHNYAWTNVYLVNAGSEEEAKAVRDLIMDLEINALPLDTTIRFATVREGLGGPNPFTFEFIGLNGLLEPETGYLPFYETARILGYGGGKLVWYKRWRGPMRVGQDAAGGLLTGTYFTTLNTFAAALWTDIPLVTRSGVPVDTLVVDPRVASWQRRDGSRRNVQSVLAG